MLQHWQRIVGIALILAVPLAAGAARGAEQPPPSKTAKKPAKPATKTKKTAAKPAARPHHGSAGALAAGHRPPPPTPPVRTQLEVPQAKNLAETPDVVLNTKVRAALIAKLGAADAEEIVPQTAKGVVTLTGPIKSKALRERAEQAARKVYGVRGVKNQLKVK